RFRFRPLNRDAPVGLVHQVVDIGTAHRVHGHSLAACHVTDDGFTANRIATSRAVDHQVVVALYLDRARVGALSEHTAYHRAEWPRFFRLFSSRLFTQSW